MNKKAEFNWIGFVVLVVVVLLVSYFIISLEKSRKNDIEEQIIECEAYNGDLSITGIPMGSRCIINGEKFEFANTVNGWKLLIKNDAYEVDDVV